MLIKFKKPDPRCGATVRMDSSRGQHFINIGSADLVSESAPAIAPTPAVALVPLGNVDDGDPLLPPAPDAGPAPDDDAARAAAEKAAAFIDGNVADVVARIANADKELISAALVAETDKGEKARKGVVDALNAALVPVQV